MDFNEFMETAKKEVYDYVANQLEDKDVSLEVSNTWSCGNDTSFNALFSSNVDSNYYEVDYSGETDQMRLEVYELSKIEKLK